MRVDALNKISCSPFVAHHIDCPNINLAIAGVDAGEHHVILEKSTVSSFSKGEETVLDAMYHNGREISGADIKLDDKTLIIDLECAVSATMFVGRIVKMKLYKLAIFEPGGHFNGHMDSTHSDEHHATVLVTLNTVWKGGGLILRRNGVETCASMQPRVQKSRYRGKYRVLQVVGLHTDTEHKVEPITKGVRIVLQYDVEVVGWAKDEKKDSIEVKEGEDGGEEGEDDDDGNILQEVQSTFRHHCSCERAASRQNHRIKYSSSRERRRSHSQCNICTENQASSLHS
jgi:hypothetical protein